MSSVWPPGGLSDASSSSSSSHAPAHDNQKTSAIGVNGGSFMAATQGSPLKPATIAALGRLVPVTEGAPVTDARILAFAKDVAPLPRWTMGEATSVHAEVLIIRAWLVDEMRPAGTMDPGKPMPEALAALKGREIRATQSPCWFCKALMNQLGIVCHDALGAKPLTGWRHPLALQSVPNADLPSRPDDVTPEWLERAAAFGNRR